MTESPCTNTLLLPSPIKKLKCSKLTAVVNTKLGGAILGLYYKNRPIMQTNIEAIDPRQTACFVMAPFCGWLPKQGFNWQGQGFQPAGNLLKDKPAVHGYAWQTECDILEYSRNSIKLNYPPHAQWPWPYRLTQQIVLNANTMSITLLYTNLAAVIAPASLGLHPYFNLSKNTQIQVNKSPKARVNIFHGNPKDECYTLREWDGHIAITSPEKNMSVIANSNSRQFLGIYRMANADSICLEPITQELNLPNIENPESGFTALEPNQSLELHVEIKLHC
jgi:galactose mutarotase-like enzyme